MNRVTIENKELLGTKDDIGHYAVIFNGKDMDHYPTKSACIVCKSWKIAKAWADWNNDDMSLYSKEKGHFFSIEKVTIVDFIPTESTTNEDWQGLLLD